MQIEADAVIRFPRERVFIAYRDELVDLVPFLPNVRGIETEERVEDGDVVRLFNVWHGGGEIPAPLAKLLDQGVLSWDDHALWSLSKWHCEWRIETRSFREAVTCSGTNHFVDIGADRTRLEIRGDLSIDLKRVRGVPSFLAGKLGRTVENFLVRQITANLTSVSEGLTRYLESQVG